VLTLVTATNTSGNTLRLPLLDTSGGYSVEKITGLGPVTATLTSSSLAQVDGAQPQNARRDVRNIVLSLGFQPDYVITTVQSLRSALYDYFLPKDLVTLSFYIDETLTYVTTGQVEDFTNDMFSADPEVDISVVCYDPDFYNPAALTLSQSTSNDTNTFDVSYAGTSECGIIFALNVNATLTDVQIFNTQPDGTGQKMEVTGSFVSGDVVTFNTIPGQKAVTLTRAGAVTSLLSNLTSSAWISFKKGDNFFRGFANGLVVPYVVTYTPKFGAV
jgi:hypothetical protein